MTRPFPRAFLASASASAGAPPAPAASLFPRAAFPQDDAPRVASRSAAAAAGDLLSLIHSAVGQTHRPKPEPKARAEEDEGSDRTSDEQPAAEPGKKRVAEGALPKRRYKKPTYIVRRVSVLWSDLYLID